MIFELTQDLLDALAAMPGEHPKQALIELLHDALRRDTRFIARHPTTLFQCMWNVGWWSNNPVARRHYRESVEQETAAGADGPPWAPHNFPRFMEGWRQGRGAGAAPPWLRSTRPPPVPLGNAQKSVFLWPEAHIERVACARDASCVLAIADRSTERSSEDRAVRAWDLRTGKDLGTMSPADSWFGCRAFFPDRYLIVEHGPEWKDTLRVMDLRCRVELWHSHTPGNAEVVSLAFSPDGRIIASGHGRGHGEDGNLTFGFEGESDDMIVRNAETGALVWRGPAPSDPAKLPADLLHIVELDRQEAARKRPKAIVYDRAFCPIILWEAESGQPMRCLPMHRAPVTLVVFSGDGSRIASLSDDQTVRVWDSQRAELLACFLDPRGSAKMLALSFDGRRVLAASSEEGRLWGLDTGSPSHRLKAREGTTISAAALLPDGTKAVLAMGGEIVIFDAQTGEACGCARAHAQTISCMVVTHDGRRIISGSPDGTIRVWDVAGARAILCLCGHRDRVTCLDVSSDGQNVLSGGRDGTIRHWDIRAQAKSFELRGHHRSVNGVAVSLDGSRVASTSDDRTVRLWDAESGEEMRCLVGHLGYVKDAVFAPDGLQLATVSLDGTARLWSCETGQPVHCLPGPQGAHPECVCYDPKGRHVAAGYWDASVRVWDCHTGELCLVNPGGKAPVSSISFSPEGRRIAWRDRDGAHYVLDPAHGKRAKRSSGREGEAWRTAPDAVELVIEEPASGKAVAWFPTGLKSVRCDHAGRVWAGSDGANVCILVLEPADARPLA